MCVGPFFLVSQRRQELIHGKKGGEGDSRFTLLIAYVFLSFFVMASSSTSLDSEKVLHRETGDFLQSDFVRKGPLYSGQSKEEAKRHTK